MRRLFVSDLHLESERSSQFRGLSWLLDQFPDHELYLLGDITELWVGDDDDEPLAAAVKRLMRKAAHSRPVYLMHGNRDFLYGATLAEQTGARILQDPTLLDDGVLLAHGDAFCTDDTEYQQFRAMVRSASWQEEILAKTLEERRAFGQALRAQSQATNANKAANIMDVNNEALDEVITTHRCHTIIHGHTHRPGRHQHDGAVRYVLGDWERCGWFLEQRDTEFTLRCFSLAPHCGNETDRP